MKIKNFLIKCLFCTIKRFRQKEKRLLKQQPQNLLVVSTTGLGDTIWGTPALRSLREKFPNGRISVLTSPIGKEVLKLNPHIDEIFVLKKSSIFSLFPLFFRIRKKNIHTVLVFHTSQRLVLPFCFLLGARHLIGTKEINKGLDFILTHPLEKKGGHEIARRFEIVHEVGAVGRNPLLELYVDNEDRQISEDFLKKI